MERTFGEKFSGIRKAIACLASGNALREVLSDEIYYINGSESLPPPLSAEEETEACKGRRQRPLRIDRTQSAACGLHCPKV